jgi:hypothetical protein
MLRIEFTPEEIQRLNFERFEACTNRRWAV